MANHGLAIFDLDGTLFEGKKATLPAVQQAFEEMGLAQPDPREILSFIGKPAHMWHAWLYSHGPREKAAQLVAAIDRYELDFIATRGQLFPGIPEALTEIRAFVGQLAICTNGPQEYVERVIADQGLGPFFDKVRYPQSTDDTKVVMVGELLAQLGGRPGVVVGDRRDDVEAAHQNGLAAIAASYGYGSDDELSAADVAVASPAELPAAIRSLFRKRDAD
jgi:phosphoglycolate phosphatase